jgi:hypothetical protein
MKNEYKPNLVDLQEICYQITNKMDHSRSKGRTASRKISNWASELDHPCLRFLVYSRVNWKDRKLPSTETEYIFEEGKDGEKKLRSMIEAEGYEIVMDQQYFDWTKYQISGRTDGFLEFEIPDHNFKGRAPLEIKTVAPYLFKLMTSIEEIKESKSYWMRKAISQLNIYMLMAGYEYGFLAIKTYRLRPRILPMLVDYELGEKCIKKCEEVNHYVAKGILPDRMNYDPAICGLCDFDHKCAPVKITKYPDEIDEEVVKELLFFKKWNGIGTTWKKTAEALRKRLKGVNAIVEGVEISSNDYETTVYDYPEEHKQIYGRPETRTKVTLKVIEEATNGK